MKKLLTIILTIALSLTFLSSYSSTLINATSTPAPTTQHEITRTITNLFYDSNSGHYMIQTTTEADGGFWVLDLVTVSTKSENKKLTKLLSGMYIGKTVHIVYSGDVETDDEVDIINTWIE